jgi:hypothetical protein
LSRPIPSHISHHITISGTVSLETINQIIDTTQENKSFCMHPSEICHPITFQYSIYASKSNKMASNTTSAKTSSDYTETASIMTTSSTSSTAQLLKDRIRAKLSASNDQRSSGEKQAARREGRLDTRTVAYLGSVR